MFTVNGKELDYDIFDVDKADAYERAMNVVVEKMAALEKEKDGMSFAKAIRGQCETVAECFDTLFGEGAQLTVKKMLSQPGQFACEERVTVVGPKKELKNVSILGPVRPSSQVEISLTDARA